MLRNIIGPLFNYKNCVFFVVFLFFKIPLLSAGKTRFSKTKKNKSMDHFLTLKRANIGPLFNFTAYMLYMYMYMYIYISTYMCIILAGHLSNPLPPQLHPPWDCPQTSTHLLGTSTPTQFSMSCSRLWSCTVQGRPACGDCVGERRGDDGCWTGQSALQWLHVETIWSKSGRGKRRNLHNSYAIAQPCSPRGVTIAK